MIADDRGEPRTQVVCAVAAFDGGEHGGLRCIGLLGFDRCAKRTGGRIRGGRGFGQRVDRPTSLRLGDRP